MTMRTFPSHARPGRLSRRGGPPAAGRCLLAAAIAGACLLAAAPARAAPARPAPGPPAIGMAVSPPRLIVPAGRVTKVQRLEIENRGRAVLHVHAEREAFTQGADGSTRLAPDAPYSAVNWITVTPRQFQVRPGAKRFVKIRIHLPRRPEPGDYQLAIVFLIPRLHGKGNIHIAEGIAVPAVITVPGPVIDSAHIIGFSTKGFSAGGSIPMTATIRDTGDVHHSFRGTGQRLTAMVNGTKVLFPALTLLRGATVTFRARWQDPPLLCLCRVTTTIRTGGHLSSATATIVVFPVFPALAAIAALIALVSLLLLARRRQRHRVAAAYQAGLRNTIAGPAPGQ